MVSSATNGLGCAPVTMVAWRLARVIATWNRRRSSSTSSARRCGYCSASARCTITCGHSWPFTRCTVESSTPPGARLTASWLRIHRSNVVGSSCNAARCVTAVRSSPCADRFMPRRLASSDATEPARPMSSIRVSTRSDVRGAGSDQLLQRLDVGGEVDHTLGVAFVGETPGELVEVDDRRLLADPVGDPRVERSRRPPQRLADVVGRERTAAAGGGEPQPGEHGAHRGAVGELEPDAAGDRHPGHDQRHLDGREQRVDPREHGDVGRWTLRCASAVSTARRDAPTASTDVSTDHPPASADAARIVLATRRWLWRSNRSTTSTTPAGQR